jgi:hypothetical protein
LPTLKYLGDSYDCATAIKGPDYIHLLDGNGMPVAAFDHIIDFSGFTLVNGSYTSPTAVQERLVAVVRDDGAVGPSERRICDLATADHTHEVLTTEEIHEICK